MQDLSKGIFPKRLNPLLFHIIFWAIWIGWPFINQSLDNEKERSFVMMISVLNFSQIPLFLINSEFLFPKLFRKKGVFFYLFWLILISIIFAIFQKGLRFSMGFAKGGYFDFRTIIPCLFISAVSLSYCLIKQMLEVEKITQEKKQEKLQSELSFLRSQISPHFIFNILNSIVYLTNSKPAVAREVTIQLSELMRYMLYESDDAKVPFATETKYLENYIKLQMIRFDDDIKINFNHDSELTTNVHIEPMLLIPFVENAFKHGIGLEKDPFINVDSKLNGNILTFKVSNKMATAVDLAKDDSSGIGLKNVSRRLELLYPNKHNLQVTQSNGIYEVNLSLELL